MRKKRKERVMERDEKEFGIVFPQSTARAREMAETSLPSPLCLVITFGVGPKINEEGMTRTTRSPNITTIPVHFALHALTSLPQR